MVLCAFIVHHRHWQCLFEIQYAWYTIQKFCSGNLTLFILSINLSNLFESTLNLIYDRSMRYFLSLQLQRRKVQNSVFPTTIFKAYKTFPSLCFQEKWRVHIHLVDIKKIKVHEKLDSYASLGHLIEVCQCYL